MIFKELFINFKIFIKEFDYIIEHINCFMINISTYLKICHLIQFIILPIIYDYMKLKHNI